MSVRMSLIAGAAVGALAVAVAGAADAKTASHAARSTAAEQALQAQVDLLKSQVEALEHRLDEQAKTQQQTQSQIQTAQSQVQAAEARARTAQSQIDAQIATIPAEVSKQVKADAPKPGWEANTVLGASIFANVSNINNTTNGVRTAQSGTDFDIKRFYFSVDHKFNDTWSSNATTDFTYDSVTGSTQLFIKKLYLQGKLNDAFIVRAGSAELPWIPFVEKLYGYRYVEKLMIDRTNFGTTTDWGIHVLGSFDHNIFSYQVSVIDGNGFRKPATGVPVVNPVTPLAAPCCQTANVDVEARFAATYAGFTAAVGGYDGYLGKAVVSYPYYHSAQRFDAVLAYVNDTFRVGGEYFWANNWNNVTTAPPKPTTTSQGYSIFSSYSFLQRFSVFGRFDWVQPATTTQPRFTDNYYNFGLSYNAYKGIDFALVYKHEPVYNNLLNTGNGVIGGLPTLNPPYGTYNEVGIFSWVRF